jgi:hypothetical protein
VFIILSSNLARYFSEVSLLLHLAVDMMRARSMARLFERKKKNTALERARLWLVTSALAHRG